MELDPSHELAIKRLAKARFDGDEAAAYEAILETGIEHTPIPKIQRPSLTPDGEPRIHYTDRQTKTNPCLPANQDLSTIAGCRRLRTEASNPSWLALPQFLSNLALICQYDGVNYDNLSFSIADDDGNWFGWGVNTLATALQETHDRYDDIGRAPGKAETVEFLLPVRDSRLHIRANHRIQQTGCVITTFDFYTPGEPSGYKPFLQAIATQFDRRLTTSKPVRRTFSFADSIPVTPITYWTGSEDELVTRLVIDCPSAQLPDVTSHQRSEPFPAECVMQIGPYVLAEEASDRRYRLTSLSGFKLTTGTWLLELGGEPLPIE